MFYFLITGLHFYVKSPFHQMAGYVASVKSEFPVSLRVCPNARALTGHRGQRSGWRCVVLSSVGCVCWDILAPPAFGHQSIPHRLQGTLGPTSQLSLPLLGYPSVRCRHSAVPHFLSPGNLSLLQSPLSTWVH